MSRSFVSTLRYISSRGFWAFDDFLTDIKRSVKLQAKTHFNFQKKEGFDEVFTMAFRRDFHSPCDCGSVTKLIEENLRCKSCGVQFRVEHEPRMFSVFDLPSLDSEIKAYIILGWMLAAIFLFPSMYTILLTATKASDLLIMCAVGFAVVGLWVASIVIYITWLIIKAFFREGSRHYVVTELEEADGVTRVKFDNKHDEEADEDDSKPDADGKKKKKKGKWGFEQSTQTPPNFLDALVNSKADAILQKKESILAEKEAKLVEMEQQLQKRRTSKGSATAAAAAGNSNFAKPSPSHASLAKRGDGSGNMKLMRRTSLQSEEEEEEELNQSVAGSWKPLLEMSPEGTLRKPSIITLDGEKSPLGRDDMDIQAAIAEDATTRPSTAVDPQQQQQQQQSRPSTVDNTRPSSTASRVLGTPVADPNASLMGGNDTELIDVLNKSEVLMHGAYRPNTMLSQPEGGISNPHKQELIVSQVGGGIALSLAQAKAIVAEKNEANNRPMSPEMAEFLGVKKVTSPVRQESALDDANNEAADHDVDHSEDLVYTSGSIAARALGKTKSHATKLVQAKGATSSVGIPNLDPRVPESSEDESDLDFAQMPEVSIDVLNKSSITKAMAEKQPPPRPVVTRADSTVTSPTKASSSVRVVLDSPAMVGKSYKRPNIFNS